MNCAYTGLSNSAAISVPRLREALPSRHLAAAGFDRCSCQRSSHLDKVERMWI